MSGRALPVCRTTAPFVSAIAILAGACTVAADVDRDNLPRDLPSEDAGTDSEAGADAEPEASQGGSGGAAGASGTGGDAGAAGLGGSAGAAECQAPLDCTGPLQDCQVHTCEDGTCHIATAPAGTPALFQIPGDCLINRCSSTGTIESEPDDTDVPDFQTECMQGACDNGTPATTYAPEDTPCGIGLSCNGQGACVGCTDPAQCGQDSACASRTCEDGVCGVSFAPAQEVPDPAPGDCVAFRCDGRGNLVKYPNPADVPPDDGNACTAEVCVAGQPSHPAKDDGLPCSDNDGAVCFEGACVACNVPEDCGEAPVCQVRTCENHQCGLANVEAGTPVGDQTAGDCRINQCDGNGAVQSVADDTDTPDDGNPCTSDTCDQGTPVHTAVAEGSPCGSNLMCNATGECVGCLVPSHCGADEQCRVRTCNDGVCGMANVPEGTAVQDTSAGDCKKPVCDGTGHVIVVNDDNDLPADDGNACTEEVCSQGQPAHPLVGESESCNQNGGAMCNGLGQCVACLHDYDCPASTNDCMRPSCSAAGTCGFAPLPSTTILADPAPGDCQGLRCNGVGGTVTFADSLDVPADDGLDCTAEACIGGVPSHPPRDEGAPCSQSGGLRCDGAGQCVGCVEDWDCGISSTCEVFACSNHTCLLSYPTTVLDDPTPGDCLGLRCNGAGAIESFALTTDVPPDDGNQCTFDTCLGGNVSHAPRDAGESCNQNGGIKCDGSGQCVPCLQDSDCGVTTACEVHTCVNHTCQVAYPTVVLPDPIDGDCKGLRCDGAGSTEIIADDSDLPPDDGNQCTFDTCQGGNVSHEPRDAGVPCNQYGGTKCDGSGQCVRCLQDSDCGVTTACEVHTCVNYSCQVAYPTVVLADPIEGDCKGLRCNGAGSTEIIADDSDLPPDDGNQCTLDTCAGGQVIHPPAAMRTACNQSGGVMCNDAGACVQCVDGSDCASLICTSGSCAAPSCGDQVHNGSETGIDCGGPVCQACAPGQGCNVAGDCTSGICVGNVCGSAQVLSMEPPNGATAVAVDTVIRVTFSAAMNAASLAAQTADGACTGSIQLAVDSSFASCVGFTSATAALSAGDSVATLTPAAVLLSGHTYFIRVTTAAKDAGLNPIGAQTTQNTGFTTVEAPRAP